jgi:hypothetical protein
MSTQENREKMLKKVFEMSAGSTTSRVNVLDLNREIGELSLDEIVDILRYYVQKNYLATAGSQSLLLTQRGIDYIENIIASENEITKKTYSIFISRIEEHKDIADKLKIFLLNAFPENLDVFVASDPDSITFSQDWFDTIKLGIRNCDFMIILCTPDSVIRPWINFEAGAATILGKNIGPICFGGQKSGNLPSPLKYVRPQAIDCLNDSDFNKYFDKFIRDIAKSFGVVNPTLEILKSEFYQAIKSIPGPSISATVGSTRPYTQGERVDIRGAIEGMSLSFIPNLTMSIYKLDSDETSKEKVKELLVPLNPDHTFHIVINSENLKPGSYSGHISLPSGEYTKVKFRIK